MCPDFLGNRTIASAIRPMNSSISARSWYPIPSPGTRASKTFSARNMWQLGSPSLANSRKRKRIQSPSIPPQTKRRSRLADMDALPPLKKVAARFSSGFASTCENGWPMDPLTSSGPDFRRNPNRACSVRFSPEVRPRNSRNSIQPGCTPGIEHTRPTELVAKSAQLRGKKLNHHCQPADLLEHPMAAGTLLF